MDKKVTAFAIAGVLVGGLIGGLAVSDYRYNMGFEVGQATFVPQEITKEVKVEVPVEVIKEIQVEVPVEKIVEIDNKNLEEVLTYIYDNNGEVSYLTEDLKDTEIDQIVDRIVFSNDAKDLATNEAKAQFMDLIDNEAFGTVPKFFDERDIERVRVQSDSEDIVLDDIDFEDKDVNALVTVHFEQDDVKYKATVLVEIKDGSVEDSSIESIELR